MENKEVVDVVSAVICILLSLVIVAAYQRLRPRMYILFRAWSLDGTRVAPDKST